MLYQTTVTQKGQITIPKALRELLGIERYDQVKIAPDQKREALIIEKAPDLVSMAGSLKVDKKLLKKYPIETMRDHMSKNYGKTEKSRL